MQNQIQELSCPVCLHVFRKPITLPCGHTFCFSCLVNSSKDNRNCPICRQAFSSTPNKIKSDSSVTAFLQDIRSYQKQHRETGKPQHMHVECKEERLLLIDITTDDLLLPFNRVQATFELQSNILIDRMERFVARQPLPYHTYGVVARLVHIQQLRRNLYCGVVEGRSFCKVESESVESEMSLQEDEEEIFYRSCGCKEISESSDSNPDQYNSFFRCFSRIKDKDLKNQVYRKINPSIFNTKNDPIVLFYSILGVLDMNNQHKYQVAVSFDEQKRTEQIQKFIFTHAAQLERDPNSLVRGRASTTRWVMMAAFLLLFLLLATKELF